MIKKITLDVKKLTTRDVSKQLNMSQSTKPANQNYYDRLFNHLGNLNWEYFWTLPFQITTEERMRYFQYKILHRIIPSNSYLKLVNIRENETCHLCQTKETIDHMFWECHQINSFWNEIETWLNEKIQSRIQLCYKDIILGLEGHPRLKVLNYIILSAKYYLFRNRFSNGKPYITTFSHFLSKKIEEEKASFQRINKLNTFRVKWEGFV